jgi:hypothetical protein
MEKTPIPNGKKPEAEEVKVTFAHFYTPEEATKHWCPFSKVPLVATNPAGQALSGFPAANRMPNGLLNNTGCISGICAAWRWKVLPGEDTENYPGTGYCGMAGRPSEANA